MHKGAGGSSVRTVERESGGRGAGVGVLTSGGHVCIIYSTAIMESLWKQHQLLALPRRLRRLQERLFALAKYNKGRGSPVELRSRSVDLVSSSDARRRRYNFILPRDAHVPRGGCSRNSARAVIKVTLSREYQSRACLIILPRHRGDRANLRKFNIQKTLSLKS